MGIALLRSNGRKGRSPFNGWRPVPPSLFIQNHCAKSENPWFFKTNSGNVNEPLMWEVRFLSETDNGDFRVCQYATRPWRLPYTRSSSKIIAPNRGSWGLGERTPEVLTNLSWEIRFFVGNCGGDKSIGGANLRKGRQPPLTAGSSRRRCRPHFYGSGRL